MQSLGAIIQTRRRAAGLTQRQLGEACGYEGKSAERTVQHWEHNAREPGITTLRPLCRALKCTLEDLIPRDDLTDN